MGIDASVLTKPELAFRASFRDAGKAIPQEWIFPQPAPETSGLSLAQNEGARVAAVAPDSLAAKAGVQAGDAANAMIR